MMSTRSTSHAAEHCCSSLSLAHCLNSYACCSAGAIGIARCFTFGGAFKRTLHDPEIPPRSADELTKEAYMKDQKKGTTINHFHEKLLKLQDLMNTKAGFQLAKQRTQYMIQFLDQFKSEWDALDLIQS
jgi:uncharacterized protein